MAARTGIPTLNDLAKEMCKYVTKFSPGLAIIYASNPALLAALAAASAACAELAKETEKVRSYEQFN
jgi:hypothetical protein